MQIRLATPDDIDEITRLYLVLRDHHADIEPDNIRYRTSDERWRVMAARALDGEDSVLLAEEDGSTVGMVIVRFADKPWGRSCEIDTLVVDEGRRNSGIGRLLMERAEEIGRSTGSPAARVNVAFNNHDGQRFYEKLGYLPSSVRLGKEL
jgi:ribosomal protein S18 acetylase RimI-like enzyme